MPLHHQLLHAGCLCEIILGNQQVTLLCDPWRIAKPRADDVDRELALEFCLPASSHRMEQSWPTRDSGAAQESRKVPFVPGTGFRADLYLAKRVLFDDLPIDRTVYELPRELDPLVYRRAPSHGEQ